MELVRDNASAIRSLIMTRYNELVKGGMDTKEAWATSAGEVAASLKPPVPVRELNEFLVGPARALLPTRRPKKYKTRQKLNGKRKPTVEGLVSHETPVMRSDSVSADNDPFIESLEDIFVEEMEGHLVSLGKGRVRRLVFFDKDSADFAVRPEIMDRVAKRLSWSAVEGKTYLVKTAGSVVFVKRLG